MPRCKARPSDPHVLRDESADPVERASAVSRLVSDQRREFEGDIARLLDHHNGILRAQAIASLLGYWRLPHYRDEAIRMLIRDPDWLVRRNAAHGLAGYAMRLPVDDPERELILRILAARIFEDPDPGGQQGAYEAILGILDRPAREYFYASRDFDPQRDVRWELVEPYLSSRPDDTPNSC